MKTAHEPKTLVEALKRSFDAAIRSPEGVVEPAALIWTDPEREWQSLMPALFAAIPQLYIFGDYEPAKRTGPVIWLKCIVERALPEIVLPENVIPIIYLPGVNRQVLRAGTECPSLLQPLVELQYRGVVWHQRNGRDWSVEAFLTSELGLGLDIFQDAQTREAALRALPVLAHEPIAPLSGRRLEAEDFDRLSVGDPVRDLLAWMSSPESFKSRSGVGLWKTFREVCKREFDFDPEEGPAAAGDALLNGKGRWDDVWRRFCEAPQLYRGVAGALRGAKPRDLYVDESRIPGKNEEGEAQLERALQEISSMPHQEACQKVLELDLEHGKRRQWVWVQLGESALCVALEALATLARYAKSPLGGVSVKQMADSYVEKGWLCDRAVLQALVSIKNARDGGVVAEVSRALYEPWLDQTTRHFQSLVAKNPKDMSSLIKMNHGDKETCFLFVDGLRFDLAGILIEKLESKGLRTRLDYQLTPLPTVTATAKLARMPLSLKCEGKEGAEDFYPTLQSNGKPATSSQIRETFQENGLTFLDAEENSYGKGGEKGAWAEVGELDKLGHKLGARLVLHLEAEIDGIVDRIIDLIAGGWNRIKVVTDHGWILVPGGMKKIELPKFLVGTKWARCAMVQGEATPAVPVYPWYWNPHIQIASPPGAGSFFAGNEYAHGGVSLQECVVPDLVVERGQEAARAKINSVEWFRLVCRVAVESNTQGLRVDIRTNLRQPNSSLVASPRELKDGAASLTIADDQFEGQAATVVVLDRDGQALDHRAVIIGATK